MSTVMESWAARSVGVVEGVRADEISIGILPDAPTATSLNVGVPIGFPRINAYVLIPNEAGATVGWVAQVRVERASYPKRKGTATDFGLVDLPFPVRHLTVVPIGTMTAALGDAGLEPRFALRRGVEVFPSVGEMALLPGPEQLKAIVQGETATRRSITLGNCPIAGGAAVYVDPNKVFGRHLAVLGNTGSGKSCTVSGLVRWSIEAANAASLAQGEKQAPAPNARFIVLDPNGEYGQPFADLGVRRFRVMTQEEIAKQPKGKDEISAVRPFHLPAWLWNGEEWAAFTGAAPGVQKPLLFDALRRLRAGQDLPSTPALEIRHLASAYLLQLQTAFAANEHVQQGRREGVADTLRSFQEQEEQIRNRIEGGEQSLARLREMAERAGTLEQNARSRARDGGYWHREIDHEGLHALVADLQGFVEYLGGGKQHAGSEDAPRPFALERLGDMVAALAAGQQQRDLSQFAETLRLRIHTLLSREQLAAIANPEDSPDLPQWLESILGSGDPNVPAVTVIDLSLVPSDVLHVVVAAFLRLVFESLQRYRRHHGTELPTVLVIEEAHHFAHRSLVAEGAGQAARLCNGVIDRIAREGRKFGLGMVVSSQRPSELSPTVLSQCNTFLLHRVVNDEDQTLLRRLIPDGMRELLRELPSLPARRAILLGWATPAPVMIDIRELPELQQPHSPDPRFWEVWTREEERDVGWGGLAADWQGHTPAAPTDNDLDDLLK